MKNIIEAIEKELQGLKDEIYFNDIQIADLKYRLGAAGNEMKGNTENEQ